MVEIDRSICIGCEMCIGCCPMECFTIDIFKKAVVNNDECFGCMACEFNCPVGAITEL